MRNKCLNPKCEHGWFGRSNEIPKTCPKCKSYYWNDEDHWKEVNKE